MHLNRPIILSGYFFTKIILCYSVIIVAEFKGGKNQLILISRSNQLNF